MTTPNQAEFQRMIESATRKIEEMQASQEQIANLIGEAETAGGKIRAKVTAGGKPTALEIDPRAMRLPSEELAEQILLAFDEALKNMAERSSELIDSIFPGMGEAFGNMLADPEAAMTQRGDSNKQISSIVESLRNSM